jgi:hypothetical protein
MSIIRPNREDIIRDGIVNETGLAAIPYLIAMVVGATVGASLLDGFMDSFEIPNFAYFAPASIVVILLVIRSIMTDKDKDLFEELLHHEFSEDARPVN